MLNLARRPFVNRRPLRRLTVVLWGSVAALSVINLFLFWSYQSGSSEARTTLRALQEEEALQGERLEELRSQFRSFDLTNQNLQVEFLNDRLRERAFPWSRLFEDLEEVLPINVRIEGLAPRNANDEAARRTGSRDRRASLEPSRKWIQLQLNGKARTSEDLLVFVERLFEHPAFASPDLGSENATNEGETQFRLEVSYLVQTGARGEEALGKEPTAEEDPLRTTRVLEETSPTPAAQPSAAPPREAGLQPSTAGASGVAPGVAAPPESGTRSAAESSSPVLPSGRANRTPDESVAQPDPGRRGDSANEAREGSSSVGVGAPRTVVPAQRVTLRETQSGAQATPNAPRSGSTDATRDANPDGRRRLGPDDLPPAPRQNPGGRDGRGGGRDRRDLFPVSDASGSGGGE